MAKNNGALAALALVAAILIGCAARNSASDQKSGQSATAALLSDPIKIDSGYISGTIIGDAGKEVRIYRGIPYAAPPVGDLRWKPPQPVTPWKGIRECAKFSLMMTQWFPSPQGGATDADMSEDCLYLNLLTPAKRTNQKLPVMVWLHGGGPDLGSGNGPEFNAPYLPQRGVVLITLNARMGAMGFLAHPWLTAESPHHASGNYGLLDIVAALQWVQWNVAAFGGDPDCVTIFGQSGGGARTRLVLSTPLAKGLFHRAIVEAGIGAGPDYVNASYKFYINSKEGSEKLGEYVSTKLGAKNLAELRAIPWQDIVKAVRAPAPVMRSGAAPNLSVDYLPRFTVDGWSLPDFEFNIISKGQGNSVPVLIGGGTNEVNKAQGLIEWAPGLVKDNPNLFVYAFNHLPINLKNAGLKPYHGLEVPFHFGYLASFRPRNIGGKMVEPGLNQDDEIVAENTMKIWVQFAKTGNPGVEGLVKWPAYRNTPGEDKYVLIDNPIEVKSGYIATYSGPLVDEFGNLVKEPDKK